MSHPIPYSDGISFSRVPSGALLVRFQAFTAMQPAQSWPWRNRDPTHKKSHSLCIYTYTHTHTHTIFFPIYIILLHFIAWGMIYLIQSLVYDFFFRLAYFSYKLNQDYG